MFNFLNKFQCIQAGRRRGSRAPEISVELSAGFGHVMLIAPP